MYVFYLVFINSFLSKWRYPWFEFWNIICDCNSINDVEAHPVIRAIDADQLRCIANMNLYNFAHSLCTQVLTYWSHGRIQCVIILLFGFCSALLKCIVHRYHLFRKNIWSTVSMDGDVDGFNSGQLLLLEKPEKPVKICFSQSNKISTTMH